MVERTKLIELFEVCEEIMNLDRGIPHKNTDVMLLNDSDIEREYVVILPELEEPVIVGYEIQIQEPHKLYGSWKKEFYLINYENYQKVEDVEQVLQTLKKFLK